MAGVSRGGARRGGGRGTQGARRTGQLWAAVILWGGLGGSRLMLPDCWRVPMAIA